MNVTGGIFALHNIKPRIYGFWFHRARHMRCMRIGWTCIGKTTSSCLSKNLDIKLPFSSLSCPPWLSCDTVLCVIFEHVAFNCVCGCMTIRHVLLSVCHGHGAAAAGGYLPDPRVSVVSFPHQRGVFFHHHPGHDICRHAAVLPQ